MSKSVQAASFRAMQPLKCTTLNENVVIHPYARIGGIPQDLKFNGEPAELHIGARTTIREGVTINIGTETGLKTLSVKTVS